MGWIQDLSQHDPYYITPVVMGVSMVVQQKMTPATGDPTQRRMMMMLPVVFTGFSVLFVSRLVDLWFGSTRTLIDPHGVTVSRRFLGVGLTRRVPSEDIEDLELKIGMQSKRTPYYDIHLRLRSGKTPRVGSSIREKRDAEWLVGAMRECLGRTAHVAAL